MVETARKSTILGLQAQNSRKWTQNASCLLVRGNRADIRLISNAGHQTRSRIGKLEVIFKLQKMAQNDIKHAEMWATVQYEVSLHAQCFDAVGWASGRASGL